MYIYYESFPGARSALTSLQNRSAKRITIRPGARPIVIVVIDKEIYVLNKTYKGRWSWIVP